jgi:hypothetical protein
MNLRPAGAGLALPLHAIEQIRCCGNEFLVRGSQHRLQLRQQVSEFLALELMTDRARNETTNATRANAAVELVDEVLFDSDGDLSSAHGTILPLSYFGLHLPSGHVVIEARGAASRSMTTGAFGSARAS